MTKTWDEVVNAVDYQPEYIWLKLSNEYADECGYITVNALFFDKIRIDRESIPKGFCSYSIRYSDKYGNVPFSVENNVIDNFYGTILIDIELLFTDLGYFKIEDWKFKDWRSVAKEELEFRLIPTDYIEYWDNLKPARVNAFYISAMSNSKIL